MIERFKRASGEDKGAEQMDLTYEGYGPGGCAVLVRVLTDNKNRTVGEVRHAFSKNCGSLGENGCVSWMFKKKGLFVVDKSLAEEDAIMEVALNAGVDDIREEGDVWEIVCEPDQFDEAQQLLSSSYKLQTAEIQMLPDTTVDLTDKDAGQMLRLIDTLEDLDDVVDVYSNADFSDDFEASQ